VECSLSYEINDHGVELRVESEVTGPIRVSGSDLFDALDAVRRSLESEAFLLCCNGARLDAYPSAMSRDMGKGLKVYISQVGKPGGELVDTLDAAPFERIATVDDQKAWHREWFESLRK
jgi:hypothetical protein